MTAFLMTILTSPAFISILGAVATAAFTAVQGSTWWERWNSKRKTLALEIVRASVLAWMGKAEEYKVEYGGKLPPDKQVELATRARADAEAIGKKMGVDVLKTLGPELFALALHEAVEHVKGVKKLPSNVEGLLR